LAVDKSESQASDGSSTVLKSRFQSEIMTSRRKARRARINAVHNQVNHMINRNNDRTLTIARRETIEEQLEYQHRAAREVDVSKD
jgi:hypothetical protein